MSVKEEKGTHSCEDISSRENGEIEDPGVGPCFRCLRNGMKVLRATRFMEY